MEDEASTILRENLENAVRQLNVEQRVIEAFQIDDDATVMAETDDFDGEETIRDHSDSPKNDDDPPLDEIAENGYEREDECLEPIDEQPEDRIDLPEDEINDENSIDKTVDEEDTPEVEDSNEGEGGTTDTGNQDD